MSLVVLVPMLGRPQHVFPLLESIEATAPPGTRVMFMLTPGDDEVREHVEAGALHALYTPRPQVDSRYIDYEPTGDFARKINAGIKATTEEHIFTGASDLKFHPGWYEAACAKLTPGVGVVGTNDLGNKRTGTGGHATHMLVTRAYVEEFGTIDEPGKFFHEGYPHEFVDDEAVETAKARGAYAHAPDAIVEHLHPMWGKGSWDITYAGMSQRYRDGMPIFSHRRRLWRRLT